MIICKILIISPEIFEFHNMLFPMRYIQTIMANEFRDELKEEFVPLFEKLKKERSINILQFHKPPAISFLRAHAPEKYGDDLSSFRFTVVKANKEGKPVRGIELGKAGLSIRGVAPIRYLGQIVGSVEFGTSFNIEAEKKFEFGRYGNFIA